MKQFMSLLIGCVLMLVCCFPVAAEDNGRVILREERSLAGGITVIDEVVEHAAVRHNAKVYQRKATIKNGEEVIGIIAYTATFHYDGTSVSVASKEVTQTSTYDGWSYQQNSFTSSGGTVTLNAQLNKFLLASVRFTMSLACDKDGNITIF